MADPAKPIEATEVHVWDVVPDVSGFKTTLPIESTAGQPVPLQRDFISADPVAMILQRRTSR
jgi:hypothetical protein